MTVSYVEREQASRETLEFYDKAPDRKFLFSLPYPRGYFPPFGRSVSGAGSTCPTSLIPLPCALPHPAAFRHQYTHDWMGCNPKPACTSNVEVEGEEGRSPTPGRLTVVRKSLGTGREIRPTLATQIPC